MVEDTLKLNTSKLGTKEYWDQFYSIEKNNFEENSKDTGECWFSDSNAEERMIQFLIGNLGELRINENSTMIDIGTGNGHLLFSLKEEGFKGNLKGIDYSENSIDFSKRISKEKGINDVKFEVIDIYEKNWNPKEKFDVVLDKGTLDAIALNGLEIEGKKAPELYPLIIKKLLQKDSILLITSCNFTEPELIKIITTETDLKVWKTIKYPSFEFGGVKGQTVCSIAFVKE